MNFWETFLFFFYLHLRPDERFIKQFVFDKKTDIFVVNASLKSWWMRVFDKLMFQSSNFTPSTLKNNVSVIGEKRGASALRNHNSNWSVFSASQKEHRRVFKLSNIFLCIYVKLKTAHHPPYFVFPYTAPISAQSLSAFDNELIAV